MHVSLKSFHKPDYEISCHWTQNALTLNILSITPSSKENHFMIRQTRDDMWMYASTDLQKRKPTTKHPMPVPSNATSTPIPSFLTKLQFINTNEIIIKRNQILSLIILQSSQVSWTILSILVDLNNAIVWMVSARPPIYNSSSPFNKSLRIVVGVSITITYPPVPVPILWWLHQEHQLGLV